VNTIFLAEVLVPAAKVILVRSYPSQDPFY
jgi:hypothetical protein